MVTRKKKSIKKIYVDRKEKPSGLYKELKKMGYKVIWKTLPVGDYVFDFLTFERKAQYQFLSDWRSKQLDKQIANMIEKCERSCLLVEYDGKLSLRDQLLVEKHSQTLSAYIWIVHTNGVEGTAETIDYYAKKAMKGELRDFKRPVGVRGRKDDQVNFICGFANIDRVKAIQLLLYYKTPMKVVKNYKNWADDIKGIGPKTTKRVSKLLNTKYKR